MFIPDWFNSFAYCDNGGFNNGGENVRNCSTIVLLSLPVDEGSLPEIVQYSPFECFIASKGSNLYILLNNML